MKKMFLFLIGAILLFAGCNAPSVRNDSSGTGSIVLGLAEDGVSNRTIVPSIDMTIATYDIYGDGPGAEEFEYLGYTGTTLEVTSLVAGTWIITVNARNGAGTIIASGSETTTVLGGSIVPVTITVTPLDGDGDLEVNVNWTAGEITSPSISGSVEDSASSSTALSGFSYTATQGTSTTTLGKGYYALFLTINDGATPLFDGLVDVVRIVYNETTIANLNVEGIGGESGVSITIEDDLDPPIEITFSGALAEVEEGEDMTVTATTDQDPCDSYQWYLDGQALSGETSASITIGAALPVKDDYRLTLVVQKGDILSSKSHLFDVVEATPVDPDMLADFDASIETNNWSGPMGPMFSESPDGGITANHDTAEGHTGSSLELIYDVSVTNSWAGFWIKLDAQTGDPPVDVPVDISSYEYISMWVKGDAGSHMKIGLNNASGGARAAAFLYINDYLDGGITTTFQEVKIPIDAFANLDGVTNVTELVLVFENAYADAAGFSTAADITVNVDDIKFYSTSLGYLRLDHYGDAWGWSAVGGNMGDMNGASSSHDAAEYHNYSRSLRSVYAVTTNGGGDGLPAWCGHFQIIGGGADGWTAQQCDFSAYRWFTFWAKANSDTENPETFKFEIQHSAGSSVDLVISGLTTSWQQFSVDLDAIGSLNQTAIKQFNIIYEDWRAADTSGVVFIDEIQLEQ